MKLKYQAFSAVSATALLLAASAALVMLGGTTSLADPIDPAARAALMSAVDHPSDALKALISQMDSQVPGSGAKFARAFRDTNTDSLATALADLSAGNAALESTIENALSTLSQEPKLASVTTKGGKNINAATVVTTVDTAMLNQTQTFANNQTGNKGDKGTGDQHSNDDQHNLNNLNAKNGINVCTDPNDPTCLAGLNPAAGPFGFNSPINSPFTRGNPYQNNSQQPGFTPQQTTNNSGRPNSRA